jgi:hypothetical protein
MGLLLGSPGSVYHLSQTRGHQRGGCFDLAGARGKLSVEDTQGGVGSSDYRGEPQERRRADPRFPGVDLRVAARAMAKDW